MLKLLIITNRLVIGGPAFHVADMAFQLQDEFDILIIGGDAAKGEETNREMFSKLKSGPLLIDSFSRGANLVKDFKSFVKIRKIIKDFQPDIVHTHTTKPGFLGRLAAHLFGVKVIVHTYHGNLFDGYFNSFISGWFIGLERFLSKRSSALIALSPQQKQILMSEGIADESKVNIIFPGIDKSRIEIYPENRKKFRARYGIQEDEIVLAIVGRLVEIKNIKLFIDGIRHLKKKGINKVRGMVVGDGPEKGNLKAYCESLQLKNVEFGIAKKAPMIFTSWYRNISELYSGIDMVVLTSKNEGTPYSLIEAQLAGIPIVAAKVGGVSDIVKENETALLYNSREEFYAQLETLVEDGGLRRKFSEAGLKYAAERFESRVMAEETKKLYLKLIKQYELP